jgi:hypothetical protein
MNKVSKVIASIVGLVALGFGTFGLAQDGVGQSRTDTKTFSVPSIGQYSVEATGTTLTETLEYTLKDPSGAVVVRVERDSVPRATVWLKPGVTYTLEITMHDFMPENFDCAFSVEKRSGFRLDRN